jgi:hypothetical protein
MPFGFPSESAFSFAGIPTATALALKTAHLLSRQVVEFWLEKGTHLG